jgi:hypothetical protein
MREAHMKYPILKVTDDMFESGTFPPFSEILKAGHDKFEKELRDTLARRKALVLKRRTLPRS